MSIDKTEELGNPIKHLERMKNPELVEFQNTIDLLYDYDIDKDKNIEVEDLDKMIDDWFFESAEKVWKISIILKKIDTIKPQSEKEFRKVHKKEGKWYDYENEYKKYVAEIISYKNTLIELKNSLDRELERIMSVDDIVTECDLKKVEAWEKIFNGFEWEEYDIQREKINRFREKQMNMEEELKKTEEKKILAEKTVRANKYGEKIQWLSENNKTIMKNICDYNEITIENMEELEAMMNKMYVDIMEKDKWEREDMEKINIWNKVMGENFEAKSQELEKRLEVDIKWIMEDINKKNVKNADTTKDNYWEEQVRMIQLFANVVFWEDLELTGARFSKGESDINYFSKQNENEKHTNYYIYMLEFETRDYIMENRKEKNLLYLPEIRDLLKQIEDKEIREKIWWEFLEFYTSELHVKGLFFENKIWWDQLKYLLEFMVWSEVTKKTSVEEEINRLKSIENKTPIQEELLYALESWECKTVSEYFEAYVNYRKSQIRRENKKNIDDNKMNSELNNALGIIKKEYPDYVWYYKDLVGNLENKQDKDRFLTYEMLYLISKKASKEELENLNLCPKNIEKLKKSAKSPERDCYFLDRGDRDTLTFLLRYVECYPANDTDAIRYLWTNDLIIYWIHEYQAKNHIPYTTNYNETILHLINHFLKTQNIWWKYLINYAEDISQDELFSNLVYMEYVQKKLYNLWYNKKKTVRENLYEYQNDKWYKSLAETLSNLIEQGKWDESDEWLLEFGAIWPGVYRRNTEKEKEYLKFFWENMSDEEYNRLFGWWFKQWGLWDCYLIAMLQSLSKTDYFDTLMKTSVRCNKDESYSIHFPLWEPWWQWVNVSQTEVKNAKAEWWIWYKILEIWYAKYMLGIKWELQESDLMRIEAGSWQEALKHLLWNEWYSYKKMLWLLWWNESEKKRIQNELLNFDIKKWDCIFIAKFLPGNYNTYENDSLIAFHCYYLLDVEKKDWKIVNILLWNPRGSIHSLTLNEFLKFSDEIEFCHVTWNFLNFKTDNSQQIDHMRDVAFTTNKAAVQTRFQYPYNEVHNKDLTMTEKVWWEVKWLFNARIHFPKNMAKALKPTVRYVGGVVKDGFDKLWNFTWLW